MDRFAARDMVASVDNKRRTRKQSAEEILAEVIKEMAFVDRFLGAQSLARGQDL